MNITDPSVVGDGTSTISVDLPSNLSYSTSYYVELDSGALTDAVGNSFAGFSGTSTWQFQTASSDVEEEVAVFLSPAEKVRRIARQLFELDLRDPERTVAAPVLRGIDTGLFATHVVLHGDRAIMATSDDKAELALIDLPSGSIERCDFPGDQRVRDLVLEGNRLFLVRSAGDEPELLTYDLTTDATATCAALEGALALTSELPDDARSLAIGYEKTQAFVAGSLIRHALDVVLLRGLLDRPWLQALFGTAAPSDHGTIQGFEGICDTIGSMGTYVFGGCLDRNAAPSLTIIGGPPESPSAYPRGTLTSPPFDAGVQAPRWGTISWASERNGALHFRVRFAASLDELLRAPWLGNDGLPGGVPFRVAEGASLSAAASHATGNRWMQWKAYLEQDDGALPVLDDVIVTFDTPA